MAFPYSVPYREGDIPGEAGRIPSAPRHETTRSWQASDGTSVPYQPSDMQSRVTSSRPAVPIPRTLASTSSTQGGTSPQESDAAASAFPTSEAAAAAEAGGGTNVPDDIREMQRQRWLQRQQANGNVNPAGASSSSGAVPVAAASSTLSATTSPALSPNESGPRLSQISFLPFEETDKALGARSRSEVLAPELRRRIAAGEDIGAGDIVNIDALTFLCVKVTPSERGLLGPDTTLYVDGDPACYFSKLQFAAWGPREMSSQELFQECVAKYFSSPFKPCKRGQPGVRKKQHPLQFGEIVEVDDVTMAVDATEPEDRIGVVTADTDIFANWDPAIDFQRIEIMPFRDTLPRAYTFNIFNEYLKPFLMANRSMKFEANDIFSYHGVEFKVVNCEPEGIGRIGKGTTIFCEGTLEPTLRDRLPPELLHQVAQLPPGLQVMLLNQQRQWDELEETLQARRGCRAEQIAHLDKFVWPHKTQSLSSEQETEQDQCMICLADFEDGEDCRRLPCGHLYHMSCIDEWLHRCTDCPLCKDNVAEKMMHVL